MSLLPEDPKDRKYMMLGLRIVGDFGAIIAVPIIVFVLIGQWLEGKYGHAPWFTISAFLLAAFLSTKMIYKKAKLYGEEYKKLDEKK
ncbi:MAG: AtpZ/AtpI family protein [Patescibacteria group bacterium]|nr:AtpZ/AtpI family protein [Patescibacteria group bacterium]